MDHSSSSAVAEPARGLQPHVRRQHTRIVGDREFPVRGSIVNIEGAKRQQRLSALARVLQISQKGSLRPRAAPGAPESAQMDLVVELQRAMRLRGEQILDEGVSKYARLSANEKSHLAMARVRVAIAEAADPGRLKPATGYVREDLARLESLLFVGSLARLSPDDVAAVRDAMRQRQLARMDAEAVAARPSCGPGAELQSDVDRTVERPRG